MDGVGALGAASSVQHLPTATFSLKKGHVRKQAHHLKNWVDRFLVLDKDNHTLLYYGKEGDLEPRRTFTLLPGVNVVGPMQKNSKPLGIWTFRIEYGHDMEEAMPVATPPLGSQEDLHAIHNRSGPAAAAAPHTADTTATTTPTKQGFLRRFSAYFGNGNSSDQKFIEFGVETEDACEAWVVAIREAVLGHGTATASSNTSAAAAAVATVGAVPHVHTLSVPNATHGLLEPPSSTSPLKRLLSSQIETGAEYGTVPQPLKAIFEGPPKESFVNAESFSIFTATGGLTVYREMVGPDAYSQVLDNMLHRARLHNRCLIILALAAGIMLLSYILNSVNAALNTALLWSGIGLAALDFVYFKYQGIMSAVHEDVEYPAQFMTTKPARGTPHTVFKTIINDSHRFMWDSALVSHKVIEKRDDHTDVVHVIQKPVWFWPLWLSPRDYVLLRYWRREEDGSYFIFYQSIEHGAAPPTSQFVRGDIDTAVYIIAPLKPEFTEVTTGLMTSNITFMMKCDLRARFPWWSRALQWDYHICLPWLQSIASLSDHISSKDYVSTALRKGTSTANISGDLEGDTAPVPEEEVRALRRSATVGAGLGKTLSSGETFSISTVEGSWGEPETNVFRIRGPTYLSDGVKIPARIAPFRLVGLDVYAMKDPLERNNLCARKGSFVEHKAGPEFTLVVNILVPTSSNLSCVMYFQPRTADWKEEYPTFATMLQQFMDGDDDFRNKRFKLIPRIAEGSFIIRGAVKSKPAIIGNKGVRMGYHKGVSSIGTPWFEIDIDVSSDPHARILTNLVIGGTKTVVVDLAFLFESQSTDELPETIFGTARYRRINLAKNKLVPPGGSLGYEDMQ